MQKPNTRPKTILISITLLVSLFPISLLSAAPNTSSTLEAIWNKQALKAQAQPEQQQLLQQHRLQSHHQAINDQHFIQNAKQAIAGDKLNPTPRPATNHPARSTKPVTKLDKQRAAWKAKWDAQQRANNPHKQAQKKSSVASNTAKKNTHITRNKPAAAPKQLTRAQYQWRFKQAQLKKQQAKQAAWKSPVAQSQQYKKPNQPKLSHATFRSRDLPAVYNSLPFEIKHKLRAAKLSEYGMSAYVQDVNSPKPLLAHKESVSRVPASVMKLITSYAALGVLGPNYRWPLDVYTRGSVQNGTLQGDLIIKGYGSPEFNTAELRKVLQGIRAKGIRNIKGRVVFDNSHFSIPKQHAGAFDGKSFAAYNAQPDALLYNERISTFHVRAKGKRVHVSTSTPAYNLKIVNRMRKTRRGCSPRISISHRGAQVVATFSGNFSSRCRTRSYSRVISKPAEMIYGSMKSLWKREVGGTFNARFAMGRTPANAKLLHRSYSRTLAQVLPAIDKDSNNVMARQLLLTIGAKYFGGQGTPRKGANAVSAWLNSRGLNFPELRIENGSGLSRHARISARHIGDLLVDAHKSPYRNVLMQSLAIAGVDGTMKRRLRGSPVRGRGFFKTGTLRDVRSIAGYIKASNGKTYAIAIMHNDPKAKHRGLAAHNKLIEWVYRGGRSNTQVAQRN